jgi:hypothetical protein
MQDKNKLFTPLLVLGYLRISAQLCEFCEHGCEFLQGMWCLSHRVTSEP